MTLLDKTLKQIVPQDQAAREKARQRLDQLTMPHWALGRLMDLAMDLAGMTRSTTPSVGERVIVTMAADHGVVAEGVSKYPQEVTVQMVYNFLHGGAGINAMARVADASSGSGRHGGRGRDSRGSPGRQLLVQAHWSRNPQYR